MNNNKLHAAIVYTCYLYKNNPYKLGAIKLNKILWQSDIESLDKYGNTITGEMEYTAKDHGPTITKIPQIMKELKTQGIIYSNKFEYNEYQQYIYTIANNKKAENLIETLDKNSKEIIRRYVNQAQNLTTREIIKENNKYIWWKSITNNSTVPVHLGIIHKQSIDKITKEI